MSAQAKAKLLENLGEAACLAFMAAVIALAAVLLGRVEDSRDVAILERSSGDEDISAPRGERDGGAGRFYPLVRNGKKEYGVVTTIACRNGSAQVAAFFGPDGAVSAVKVLASSPSGLDWSDEGWFAPFLGKTAGEMPYRAKSGGLPDLVLGHSARFEATAETLSRLSRSATSAAREK